jgi:hypothetical protein
MLVFLAVLISLFGGTNASLGPGGVIVTTNDGTSGYPTIVNVTTSSSLSKPRGMKPNDGTSGYPTHP